MKRRAVHTLLALLALAVLAIVLRQDLANLAVYQGDARLRTGDVGGAQAAFSRAAALGAAAAPLAYNLGVSLYRTGDYRRAHEQFGAALATAAPALAVAIHYNRGNCQFRQGERLVARDPEGARRFYQEAAADYGRALALAPRAADAGGNLKLARTRLAALGGGLAPADRQRSPGADQAQQSVAGKGARDATRQVQQEAAPRKPASAGAAQEAERADAAATQGKSRRDLTRSEAERLLNDARGREKPAGMPHGEKDVGQLGKPERDW
jgi:tetratricopeptide (TPR) repeat protein